MLMKKIIFGAIISIISVQTQTKILIQSLIDVDRHQIIDSVFKIVEKCDTINTNSLLVAGNFENHDIQLFSKNKPVILFDQYSDNSLIERRSKKVNIDSIKTTIVSTNSKSGLQKILDQIKKSKWWNSFGHFIIFNESSKPRNCNQARTFLNVAWEMDLINTIFLCTNSEREVEIYNYNPYSNWTPKGWILSKIINYEFGNDKWYLYYRQNSTDLSTCDEVFFDKTLHLGNYTGIRAATSSFNEDKCDIYSNYNTSVSKRFDVTMAEILFDKLNIPFNYNCSFNLSGLNSNGYHYGIVKDLADNKYDLMLDYRYMLYSNLTEASVIVGESGITFVGNDRGFISIFEAMVRYFRVWFLLATVVIILITIIVLRLTVTRDSALATVEVFRLFFGNSLSIVPDRTPPRLVLATIFFFVLIIQTLFSSAILKFITEPTSKNFQTFNELEQTSDYDLYCVRGFHSNLKSEVSKRCNIINNTCAILSNTSNAVCVYDKYLNLGFAKRYNLYTSQDILSKRYMIYRMRKNWALSKRVNDIYTRLFESGITNYTLQRAINKITKKAHVVKKFRPLEQSEMAFVFEILMVGFILGIGSFLLELKFRNMRN